MLGRQQNGYILNGLSILLPRDFVPYKSQTSMSIVPCGATMDKGIEGKVFTMQQRNYSRDLYLVEKDTVMNAHVQAIREEKEDIGFYARVPRIVRTGYKELSHAEKWLYTCLRDLCGEAGECWRSLRALAKETGISIASLSSMIPHLAQVGLIDAMKKSTWFIKIKNIWQANKEYCSKNEHSASGCSENEQGVQKMNTDCSENEQGCSNFVTKEDISKKIESEEDNTKKDISSTGVDDAIARKYKEGLLPRNSPLSEWLQEITLMDDAFLAEMEQLLDRNQPAKLSPTYSHVDNDTSSHIVKATRKEAAPPTIEQPHALQDALPQSATSPPAKETRKHGKVKIPPTPEELAFQERCRGIQAAVNEWRGYGLTKQGAIINEHKCIRTLCEKYTDEQIRHIREYLFTTHWRWSKPDNRYTIGACTILEEAGNVIQILKNGTGKTYKPSPDEELVEWQGQMMTVAEADKRGFNGGFGEYVSQQQF